MFCFMEYQRPPLPRVQNIAARLITKTPRSDHITPVLKELHWLPIERCLQYKVLLYTYKALHDISPSYLTDLLVPYQPTRSLRSEKKSILQVPCTRTLTYGDRSFRKSAPVLWNSLPEPVKSSTSVAIFKKRLKTYLFKQTYI